MTQQSAKEISAIALPIVTLVVGGLIGFIWQLILARKHREESLIGKLFDHYLTIRKDITDTVSKVICYTYAEPESRNLETLKILSYDVSRLHFAHFDLLPNDVAIELLCLFACLLKKGRNIYRCNNARMIVPMNLKNRKGIMDFLSRVSIAKNILYFAPNVLMQKENENNKRIRRDTILKIQAFSVLASLNANFRYNKIIGWGKSLKKQTIADR